MPRLDLSTMVVTMGGQPQVVTFALDDLIEKGEVIKEVIVIHLTPQDSGRTRRALARLTTEFAENTYAGQPCRLRFFPVRHAGGKLEDIRNEAEANVAWLAIYHLIADLKAQGRHLHVCISGGRRILALLAVSTALLHFDHNDHLWHMYTDPGFLERARDGAIMHATQKGDVQLIEVPLAPWGAYFPPLRALAQASPQEVVAAQTHWLDEAERRRCRQVVKQLTPRELDTLHAFAAGQNPQEVAETLCVTVRTVHAHKTVILAECRNAWELPPDARLTYYFLREKFGRYFQVLDTV
jgi:CRISPR-associated protein Csx14